VSYRNLINVASASIAESFKRIRDFICRRNGSYDYSATGIGWTLWDSSYAVDENAPATGDWFVIKSIGENGKQDLYYRFILNASTITVYGYLYWNAATNAGIKEFGSPNAINISSGATTLWIYGDLDHVCIGYVNTSNYLFMMGAPHQGEGFYDNAIAVSSASVSTGSNVVVTVDAVPDTWYVGQKLYHWDTAGLNVVTIAALGAGTVTLATVSAAKLAGNKLSGDIGYFCSNSNALAAVACVADRSTGAVGAVNLQTSEWAVTVAGTDALNSKRASGDLFLAAAGSAYGKVPDVKITSATGATHNTPYTDQGGNTWRLLLVYSGKALMVKEV